MLDPDFAALVMLDDYQVFLTEYDQHERSVRNEPDADRLSGPVEENAGAAGRFGRRVAAKARPAEARKARGGGAPTRIEKC